MVAIGAMDPAAADAAIGQTMAATNRPFGANVFVHPTPERDPAVERAWCEALRPAFAAVNAEPPTALDEIYRSFNDSDEILDVLLARRPAVVSFHFGAPSKERARALKQYGAILFGTATSVAEAHALVDVGIDVVVAQGVEAGGHHGPFLTTGGEVPGTLALVRQIVQAVDVPVLAAGGIADGRGIAAALALGAEGAQLGTALVTATESLASADYRRQLVRGAPLETALTSAVSGRAARGIPGRLFPLLEAIDARVPAYPVAYDATKRLLAAASRAGVKDYAVQWAGQGAGFNRELPAAALVEWLGTELEAELARLGGLVR
jgi:nitronate monooxygenase